jgi:DEP domain-containing protein 5
MSRNLPLHASAPRHASPWASHTRHLSRASAADRPPDFPRSPDTVSSSSTLRHAPSHKPRHRVDRLQYIHICDPASADDVLAGADIRLNLGLLENKDIMPGQLMTVVADRGAAAQSAAGAGLAGRKFVFVVRDIPKESKTRHHNVEIFIAKHVADAFGLRGPRLHLEPVWCLVIARLIRQDD